MSSLRVRAQNTLLNKIGAAKPSKNVQFDVAHESFHKVQGSVVALDSALRGYIMSLKAHHIAGQVLYGAIEAMGGTPENSSEMKEMIQELKASFVAVDVNVMNSSIKRYEDRVLRPSGGWVGRATIVNQQVAAFEEEKKLFDHYSRKVMSLREARDKRAVSGKVEKPKDVEKLVRNEQKLAATTNSYTKLSESTVANLRSFVNTREETLSPIIQRVLDFRVQHAQHLVEETQRMQQMIKHDATMDHFLSTLDKFSTHFTTVDGTVQSQVVVATQGHVAVETPIQALTFESFVGEAPPQTTQTQSFDDEDWTSTPPPPPPAQHRASNYTTHPPPPPPPLPMSSPTSSSNTAFFDDFSPSPTSHYQTAPMPMPSSPQASCFTPWEDVPEPPQHHQFLPSAPSSPVSSGWDDAFADLHAPPPQTQQYNSATMRF